MADQSDILSNEFNSNLFFEENSHSDLLSVDVNADSISTNRTNESSAKFFSIHQHTREIIKEDKLRTKKRYLCKYCSSDDLDE
jgi:hypothetical protein